jgi:hypothetical protein
MDPTPLTLKLRPLHDGACTEITLTGPIVTAPQAPDVRKLLSLLRLWHGGRIDVVLCVDGTNAGACWLDVWDDVLGRVPGRLLRARYLISRDTLAAGTDHER